jgi:HEAT repeat protein
VDPCEDLERVLFDAELTRSECIVAIAGLVDVEECIAEGLSSTAADGAWGRFERWLLAAYEQPSRALTPMLCEVLARRMPEVNNEDLVEVLGEIGDPRAVDAIEDALLWEPDWDEFHALGVKCVWALGAIATPEARSMLEDAASVGPEEVRSAAQLELQRLDAA